MIRQKLEIKELIKKKARQLGFELTGICRPDYSPSDHDHLLRWLNKSYNGEMAYMERNPRLRSDPRLFMENVKSIIAVGINYYKEPGYRIDRPYVSIYARGKSYQDAITDKLTKLLDYIRILKPGTEGKTAVDTSPTLDKLWAEQAGLGWRGKNTLLINKKIGSFIFLGELFLNFEVEPDTPESSHCADCIKCIEACPTGALEEPHLLNATKCISYLTIESKGDISDPRLVGNHILGCDLCQLACPFNKNAPHTNIPEFQADDKFSMELDQWINLTEKDFQSRYMGTIFGEHGFIRCTRNIEMAGKNIK